MLGTRSDPRSDIFSLGVVLYELVTGELPFGIPRTMAGMRDRLWMDPVPPSAHSIETTPWLQEIILRCLEPNAAARYQSAAHIAFDLRHPHQVALTERSTKSVQAGFFSQVRRWWLARGERSPPRRLPNVQVSTAPVIMVAVDTTHPHDERLPALQRVTGQVLSLSAEFRLACVSVIGAGPMVEGKGDAATASGIHREHLVRLRHWVAPLNLPPHRLALHVVVAASPADALLEFSRQNHVDLILLGAPRPSQHALAWWRSAASTVTAHAHCSVHVVRVPGEPDEAEAADASQEQAVEGGRP
jgi:nucleotide-binding universal stress UspA family protein